ncbi:MAG TPA: hypothetical protein VGR95_23235 [Thermoanaerobaculia bacterium]|jgi:hypothetical protein|nr:hypothetical protein [Thermoanaerobaculia bacterium]
MTIASHHAATVLTTPIAFGACGPKSDLTANPTANTARGLTPNNSIAQTATTAPIGARTKT